MQIVRTYFLSRVKKLSLQHICRTKPTSYIMLIALLPILLIICAILLLSYLWERRKCLRMQKRLFRESRKLEHTNHIASAILKNVHAYILLIDNDFKVLKTNYYQLTGTQKGLEEKRVGDLLQCRNALSAEGGCGTHAYCGSCPIRCAIRQAFEQRRGFTDLEATLNVLTSEKKSVECDAVISGSYFLLNEEENMVLTVHDITQLKETEKQLTLAKEKAENADLSKSAFLANMSHEIRTPLNAITGFAEVLASANTEEEKAQYQEIIKMNADLLLQLVNDILDMSKIEAGTLEFVYTKVDINLLLSDLRQLFQMRVNDAGKNIQIIAEPSLPSCSIETDRNRVAQVLSNFTTNAIKFTPNGGKVAVRLAITEPANWGTSIAQITVSDSGRGIAAEFLPFVFESFRQADSSTTRTYGGLGLGLAIVRHLVELHGGTVKAESLGEGQGSTFIVQLLLLSHDLAPVRLAATSPFSDNSYPLQGIRILIVDDDGDMRDYVSVLLEQAGAEVKMVSSASEAMVVMMQTSANFDLIVSDIGMPQTDGYMLLHQIRQLLPDQGGEIPAIALTAYATESDSRKAIAAGFQRHLSKPVEPDDLIQAIVQLLGRE